MGVLFRNSQDPVLVVADKRGHHVDKRTDRLGPRTVESCRRELRFKCLRAHASLGTTIKMVDKIRMDRLRIAEGA